MCDASQNKVWCPMRNSLLFYFDIFSAEFFDVERAYDYAFCQNTDLFW